MRVADHNSTEGLHQLYRPPERPPTGLMVDVLDEYLSLNGVINCVYERKTNQTYQLTPDMWGDMVERYSGRIT